MHHNSRAGLAEATASGANPPQQSISNAMISELQNLIDRAQNINVRGEQLRDRIFGSQPTGEAIGGEKSASPNGFLDEANRQLNNLNYLLNRISDNLSELERLA